MTKSNLPHDRYITAVCEALTAAGLEPAESWTDDAETRGTYCYLNAVITLDPSDTVDLMAEDIPVGTSWPHGLILIWEWHTGLEEDGPERGPVWQFAALKADGSNEYPTDLPVQGYASPTAVVDAARKVISREIRPGDFYNLGQWRGWDGGIIGDSWERNGDLEAAVIVWADAEGGDR